MSRPDGTFGELKSDKDLFIEKMKLATFWWALLKKAGKQKITMCDVN